MGEIELDCRRLSSGLTDRGETCRAHLVGIAGSGMRALADVLLGYGWKLTGSDLNPQGIGHLARAGVRLLQGHKAEYLPSHTEVVIHSDAVGADNPELRRAAKLGIPVYSYFDMLGRISRGRHTLAVAGTHGKSTTTAMAAAILTAAGCDPTVFCGATPLGRSSGGRPGNGDLMLVEACEYRANFLHLRPRHAAILGIEPDHFDCYDSPWHLEDAFGQFARSIRTDGLLLVRHDCPVCRRIGAELPCRVETFGFAAGADWSAGRLFARRGRWGFDIRRRQAYLCDVKLQMPGRHNVLNALAAAALSWQQVAGQGDGGRAGREIAGALSNFRGLHRRLELRGTHRGVAVVDDYAHHPTEVAAALTAVRRVYPRGRVWCVFQPHQASRTERLLDELAESLQNADIVLVAEIFRARELPPGSGSITAADLAHAVRKRGSQVADVHDTRQIAQLLQNSLLPGDVLVTMGAGDIGQLAEGFCRQVAQHSAAG